MTRITLGGAVIAAAMLTTMPEAPSGAQSPTRAMARTDTMALRRTLDWKGC